VLHRFSPGGYQYQWVNVDTGAVLQELTVPHRRKNIVVGLVVRGQLAGPAVRDHGRIIALRDFIRMVPEFARGKTLDREFKLNSKQSLLYDSEDFTGNESSIVVARLTRNY